MKHALLRLGPNTTLLSPYFPSLRFSPPSPSLTLSLWLYPALRASLQAGCSNRSSDWRLLAIPYHRCSVTCTHPSGCVFTLPSTHFPLHASSIPPQVQFKLSLNHCSSTVCGQDLWVCLFDWQTSTHNKHIINITNR